jgi:ketosteroid isomerase-like protein
MSNLETVQGLYEAFGTGDVPAILECMAEDVEWERWGGEHTGQEAGVPWLARRSGVGGVGEFFEAVAANLEFHSFEPTNMLEGGNQVAVTIAFDATAKQTGERFQDEEIHLWTFDDQGKVSAMRHYADTAKHIRAAKGSLAEVG